jgi:hypothetical protein
MDNTKKNAPRPGPVGGRVYRSWPVMLTSYSVAAPSLASTVVVASLASLEAAMSAASDSAMARRSASSIASLTLRAWWYAMPVPAGIRRPTITFSFRPRSSSRLPMIAASVSTRVVSWNEAAEMNESVDSDAFVIPSSRLVNVAGILPSARRASLVLSISLRSTCSPEM